MILRADAAGKEGIERDNRALILEVVSQVPGIHLREMERTLGISFNTVRHHVRSLSTSGLISCANDGGYVRLYPISTTTDQKLVYKILRSKLTRKILAALLNEGEGLSNKQICDLTGLAKSTVSEHVQLLLKSNLVGTVDDGRGTPRIKIIDPDCIRGILLSNKKAGKTDLVQSFLDLWDF